MNFFGFTYLMSTLVSIKEQIKPINIYHLEETETYPVFRGTWEIGQQSNTKPKFHNFQGIKYIAGFYYLYARDYIFMLDLKNQPGKSEEVRYNQAMYWKADNRSLSLCKMKGRSQSKCHNFVQIFEEVHGGDGARKRIKACATNAFNPICRHYELDKNGILTYTEQEFGGKFKISFDPSYHTESLVAGNNLYTAAHSGFLGHDPVIMRMSLDRNNSSEKDTTLTTIRGDATWLNAPKFVGFVDGGQSLNKVFTFFTEVAIEDKSKQVYSRVGQVCKNDQGGSREFLRNKFSSFFKARLNCSLPGETPFYFNEIRDITDLVTLNNDQYRIGNTKVVFAIMNTPRNSISASAVCVFTLPDIEAAMSGDFLEKYTGERSDHSYWAKRDIYSEPHPTSCQKHHRNLTARNSSFVRTHPIMYNSVNAWNLVDNLTNPHNAFPLFYATNTGNFLTALAVDTAAGIYGNYTTFIAGTEDGKIIKVLVISKRAPVVIEERSIFSNVKCGNGSKSVLSITLDKPTDSMLVAFKNCVVIAPLCHLNTTSESKCIQSRDPYCAWDGRNCMTVDRQYSNNITNGTQSRQDVLERKVVGLADSVRHMVGCEICSNVPTFQPPPPAEVAQNSKSNISLLTKEASIAIVTPLAPSSSSPWLVALVESIVFGLIVLCILIVVIFCVKQKKLNSSKMKMGEKHEIIQTKPTIPNSERGGFNQFNGGRSSSKPCHPCIESQEKKRGSTQEETGRKRQITATGIGSLGEEEFAFLSNDQETIASTTSSHDVPDTGRNEQLKMTSGSQGGWRRAKGSKPSTSSSSKNSEERRSASQKRHSPISPGEVPTAYKEGIHSLPGGNVGQNQFQGSDSRFSFESLKTPFSSDRMFSPNVEPSPQKVRPGLAPSMSFHYYNPYPNMRRTHSMGTYHTNTVDHPRPQGINRQHSLQVTRTLPARYQQQHVSYMFHHHTAQHVSPNVPPAWVNQTLVTNSTGQIKMFDNRHSSIANVTHSLDRWKMLKRQTQCHLLPNKTFDDHIHHQVMDPRNGYPSYKRWMSGNAGLCRNKAGMPMRSRSAPCQAIHEEHGAEVHYQM